MTDEETKTRIAELNDHFRKTMRGRVYISAGVRALPDDVQQRIGDAVRGYDRFTALDDLWPDHSTGFIKIDGLRVVWLIHCLDPNFAEGISPDFNYTTLNPAHLSADPSSNAATARVLRVLLASEHRAILSGLAL